MRQSSWAPKGLWELLRSPWTLADASQMELWPCVSHNQEMGSRGALPSSSPHGCGSVGSAQG